MLHYLRSGEREASPQLERRIQELEVTARIRKPADSVPTLGKEHHVKFQPLEVREARAGYGRPGKAELLADLSGMSDDLVKLTRSVERLRIRVEQMEE
jgi:hypothetical protein